MIFRYGPGLWAAIYVHIAGERENGAPGLRGREGVLCESRDKTRPLRIRSVRGMDDDIRSAAASTTDSLERRSNWTTSVPAGNPPAPDDGRTTARTWWPARPAPPTTAPPMDPLAPRTTIRTPPRRAAHR